VVSNELLARDADAYALTFPGRGATASPQAMVVHRRPGTRLRRLPEAVMSQTFYVYILASRYRGTIYVGVSNDIARRVGEHKSGAVKEFTQRYKVKRLVYFEAYGSILEARARERVLKRWRREWKFDLIEKLNPDWRDLTPQLAS
jgi:putative endonuclease